MKKDLFTIAREKALAELHKRNITKEVAIRTLEIYKELKEEANKGYIVKLTQKNTENGAIQYFYLGADGYTHTEPDYVTPYKRKGNALNFIKRETQTDKYLNIERVNENSCLELKKWLNTYEVISTQN